MRATLAAGVRVPRLVADPVLGRQSGDPHVIGDDVQDRRAWARGALHRAAVGVVIASGWWWELMLMLRPIIGR